MDIAIIIIFVFVSFFIAIFMMMEATHIRTLREKIAKLEEEKERMDRLLVKASAELNRLAGVEEALKKEQENAAEELRLSESHQKWFRCEAKVRAYIMSDDTRMKQLRNAGHLDRQYWVVQSGTKILFACEEEEMGNELVNWWEDNKNNF